MNVFYEGQVLWSQLDANQHMRHSAYADFGDTSAVNHDGETWIESR